MRMIMVINDKPSERWLCEDCASDLLPPGLGTRGSAMSPEKALDFLRHLLGSASGEQAPKQKGKDGFRIWAT